MFCNQKRGGPSIIQPIELSPSNPSTPILTVCCTSTNTYPLLLQTTCLPDRRSSSIRTTTDLATQDSTQHTALIMPHTQMHPRERSNSHYLIIYIVQEHKHCLPRTRFLTNRGSDRSSKLSFSLRNSSSNELNHTSDATEDHDHG
jgi:hypothetical protein